MIKKFLNILVRYWIALFLFWMGLVFWFTVYFELGLNWKLMIFIWTGIVLFVKFGGFLNKVPIRLKKLWLVSIFLYPLVETIIRIYIAKDIIAYSWRYFNLAEHFVWMMFLLIISYPLFYETLKKLDKKHRFLHLFGFLMIIGIANEVFEYIMRVYHQVPQYLLASYYKDTIYDLSINVPGVIAGMLLVHWLDSSCREENNKELDASKTKRSISTFSKIKVPKPHKIQFKKRLKQLIILGLLFLGFIFSINYLMVKLAQPQIFSEISNLPEKQTALLLGARVYGDGTLSLIMQDRADTAIEIYEAGKVQKILVSGDHGTDGYDEVNAIKEYLLNEGIDKKDIFTDHAGFDTYDSIYRARDIFQVESMVIVTQEFHLSRAVYLANSLGIENVGVVADKWIYYGMARNNLRESIARTKAFFNVIFKAKPKFLGEVIPITGNSSESWD